MKTSTYIVYIHEYYMCKILYISIKLWESKVQTFCYKVLFAAAVGKLWQVQIELLSLSLNHLLVKLSLVLLSQAAALQEKLEQKRNV